MLNINREKFAKSNWFELILSFLLNFLLFFIVSNCFEVFTSNHTLLKLISITDFLGTHQQVQNYSDVLFFPYHPLMVFSLGFFVKVIGLPPLSAIQCFSSFFYALFSVFTFYIVRREGQFTRSWLKSVFYSLLLLSGLLIQFFTFEDNITYYWFLLLVVIFDHLYISSGEINNLGNKDLYRLSFLSSVFIVVCVTNQFGAIFIVGYPIYFLLFGNRKLKQISLITVFNIILLLMIFTFVSGHGLYDISSDMIQRKLESFFTLSSSSPVGQKSYFVEMLNGSNLFWNPIYFLIDDKQWVKYISYFFSVVFYIVLIPYVLLRYVTKFGLFVLLINLLFIIFYEPYMQRWDIVYIVLLGYYLSGLKLKRSLLHKITFSFIVLCNIVSFFYLRRNYTVGENNLLQTISEYRNINKEKLRDGIVILDKKFIYLSHLLLLDTYENIENLYFKEGDRLYQNGVSVAKRDQLSLNYHHPSFIIHLNSKDADMIDVTNHFNKLKGRD